MLQHLDGWVSRNKTIVSFAFLLTFISLFSRLFIHSFTSHHLLLGSCILNFKAFVTCCSAIVRRACSVDRLITRSRASSGVLAVEYCTVYRSRVHMCSLSWRSLALKPAPFLPHIMQFQVIWNLWCHWISTCLAHTHSIHTDGFSDNRRLGFDPPPVPHSISCVASCPSFTQLIVLCRRILFAECLSLTNSCTYIPK